MRITAATPLDQIKQFVKAVEAVGAAAEMGAQSALNDVSLDAKRILDEAADTFIDRPTKFTTNAFVARFGRVRRGQGMDAVSSEVAVKDLQSAYMKFGLGEETRLPGDIGPAHSALFVPNWKSAMSDRANRAGLKAKPTPYGGMLTGLIPRLASKAERSKTTGKREPLGDRAGKPRGVFFGKRAAAAPKGYWLRPERKRIRVTKTLKSGKTVERIRSVEDGVPMLVVSAHEQLKYTDLFTPAWEKASLDAMVDLPRYLERELDREIAKGLKR